VEDVGADRPILISESGDQSGAHAVVTLTNITLISLDQLREAAKAELLSLGLSEIRRRAAAMKQYVFSLWKMERHERGFSTSKLRAGVDAKLATKIGSTASVIDTGAEQAQLGAFPAPLMFADDGNTIIRASDLDNFVVSASRIVGVAIWFAATRLGLARKCPLPALAALF
jgi:hypothetical protein